MPNDHGDVMYKLGKIEGTLQSIDDHLAALNSKVAKHEQEMSSVRLAAAKFGGIVITVTAALGFAWTFLAQYVKMKLGIAQ
jgi:hypothetical protein